MKPIYRHRNFEKNFRKRISSNPKLMKQFELRLEQFIAGNRDYPLNDHALIGSLVGRRAFSVTADVRVIYFENEEGIVFIDIGTHNQVY